MRKIFLVIKACIILYKQFYIKIYYIMSIILCKHVYLKENIIRYKFINFQTRILKVKKEM